MRHRRKAKYFGVKTAHRKAMFRNMVTSLFRHGRITTTVPRAKELRRLADRLITLAKDGTLHARRQALSIINDKEVVARLFSDIADQMASRNGGYTRIVRIGPRRGDGAMMCIIELVKESLRPGKSKTLKTRPEQAAPTVIPEAKEESAVQEGGLEAETASEEAASSEAEEKVVESEGGSEEGPVEPSDGQAEQLSAASGETWKEPEEAESESAFTEEATEPVEEASASHVDETSSTEDAGRKE